MSYKKSELDSADELMEAINKRTGEADCSSCCYLDPPLLDELIRIADADVAETTIRFPYGTSRAGVWKNEVMLADITPDTGGK